MAMRCMVLLLVCCVAAAGVRAEEKKEGQAPAAGQEPAWMEKFKPGPEHEGLKKFEGTWDVAVKMWMDPAQPPQETKGTAEFKMVLGGRWLRQEYKSEIMGKPYHGVGYEGYDRVAGKYVGSWSDDMSTSMAHLTGTSKDGGKTIEYFSEQQCPMEPAKLMKSRYVHKEESADKFVFELYQTLDGKESKCMELVYTRKK